MFNMLFPIFSGSCQSFYTSLKKSKSGPDLAAIVALSFRDGIPVLAFGSQMSEGGVNVTKKLNCE